MDGGGLSFFSPHLQKLMTLQTKDVSEVTQFTVEALQYRINPCLHETQRQTVESLLYIPPLDPLEAGLGKLWLGLGNGCLKVYDMDEKCFESNIKISDAKGKSLRLVSPHLVFGSWYLEEDSEQRCLPEM